MKTKTKFYSLIAAVFFLSVFFVKFDQKNNIAKADCWSVYGDCYDKASDDDEATACYTTYETCNDSGSNTNVNTGNGNNNLYEACPAGYKDDPSDPNSCIPADACADGKHLVNGECVDDQGNASECDYGYIWDGKECTAADSCPDGYAYLNGQCVDTKGNATESDCDPSPSCWFYNCCSSASTDNTPDKQTPEQKAAADKAAAALKTDAKANVAAQQAAYQKVQETQSAVQKLCGNMTSAECIAAKDAYTKAQQSMIDADTAAKASVEAYNAAAVAAGADPSTGGGYVLCANGILATVCQSGGGTPYVAGISTTGYSGGSGLGGIYSTGGTGVVPPKCGANFKDIGGVCFPMNTGLSDAPIYVILSNLFSWLMGLFTTLAVLAFVISGIQYLTASVDEDQVEAAKKNATYALIGIIIGLSGFIIIKAIAAGLSGQSYFF